MKIIVTGGAGFIGSNFVHHMVNKYPDYEIINLDLLTYAGNLENLKPVENKPNYRFVKGDIADRKFIFDLFEKEKPDVVVNFAAESHVDRSITDPEAFVRTNVMGTTTLLDACRTYGIKRYHQVSTDEVYGDLPLDRPDLFFTETTPLHTSSPYSSSKASADLFVLAYHRTYGTVSYTHLSNILAIPILWRSPPESLALICPISVSYPSGKVWINSAIPARLAASLISSIEAPGFAIPIFSAMVMSNR